MSIIYDYIIIGAGPTGVALAWYLQKLGPNIKILLLDREASIGGCHRVRRVNGGDFSEHGPRVYLDNYVHFQALLDDIFGEKDSFHRIFTEYKFSGTDFIRYLKNFYPSEILALGFAMARFIINPSYGAMITMKEFTRDAGFSEKSRDYIDRLCILTDGGTGDRYTLNQFLEIANQNILYRIYQPRASNDRLLWHLVDQRLKDQAVTTLLGDDGHVLEILEADGRAVGVRMTDGRVYYGQNILAATPPQSLVSILSNSSGRVKSAFGDFRQFSKWSNSTAYDTYIPMVFYFPYTEIESVWGVPSSDWGVASIVLSDYLVDLKYHSKTGRRATVITVAITRIDRVSSYTGRTANETQDRAELISETFRQLNQIYHQKLPSPSKVIVSPEVSRDYDRYTSSDTAYFKTVLGSMPISNLPNFHSIGVQNGESEYAFTSLEAAVANAHHFIQSQHRSRELPRPKMLWTIRKLLALIVTIILILFLIVIYWPYFRSMITGGSTRSSLKLPMALS